MIRRQYRDGWLLIPQPAHAWVSGQMAAHWGGNHADSPRPYHPVVLGTTLHDSQWYQAETQLPIDTFGQPRSFLDLDIDAAEPMYEGTVHYAAHIDLYAGLLVNHHIRMIFRSRAQHGRDTPEAVQPLLNRLVAHEQNTLKQLQDHPQYSDYIDSDTIAHNYRILRTCDSLSLFLCGAFPTKTLPNVPFKYGELLDEMQADMPEDGVLRLHPYPFDEPELHLSLDARYVPGKTFGGLEIYQQAYAAGEVTTLEFTVTGM